jgi:hypothetical protein
MATPIKSLFPPIEKKPFLLNKQKAGAVARRRVSTLYLITLIKSLFDGFSKKYEENQTNPHPLF